MKRGCLIAVLGLLALLSFTGIALQACGGGRGSALDQAKDSSMTLSSGMDKKVSGYAEGSGSNANYDSQYRTPTASSPMDGDGTVSASMSGDASTPERFGEIKASPLLAGASDELAKLNAWLSPAAYAADNQVDERYLIRTGELHLLVKDFEPARQQVAQVALKYGGTVTNADIAKAGDGMYNGYITLRVPNTKFFAAFEELLGAGEVASQKMESQDVSQDYITSISRLKTLTAQEDTLRQLLAEAVEVQRKRGLGEGYKMLLDTEQRLSDVSNEIQRVEDQLSALADQVTRSTITVQLTEQPKVATKDEPFNWGLGATFESSKKELVLGLRGFTQGLIHFLVTCWLWLLPWSLILFAAWKLYKRYLLPRLRANLGVPPAAPPPAEAGGAA